VFGFPRTICVDMNGIIQPSCNPEVRCGDFVVGSRVYYNTTNEYVMLSAIHKDDPDEIYYTIRFSNGNERQTVLSKLCLL
jgi:hypothetical protein